MRNIYLCIIPIIFCIGPSKANAVDPPSIIEVLEKIQKTRGKLPNKLSYLMYRENFSNDDRKELILKTLQQGELIHDKANSRWVCLRRDEILQVNSDRPEITDDPTTWKKLFLFPNGQAEVRYFAHGKLRLAGSNGLFVDAEMNKSCEFPNYPLDFRMLGISNSGDYSLFTLESYIKLSIDQQKKNQETRYSLSPEWVMGESNGIARYYFNDYKVDIDLQKDFWPVRFEQASVRKVLGQRVPYIQYSTRLEHEQVDGVWVPKYADVVSPRERFELFMDWSNIESPDKLDFSESVLSSRVIAAAKSSENATLKYEN